MLVYWIVVCMSGKVGFVGVFYSIHVRVNKIHVTTVSNYFVQILL